MQEYNEDRFFEGVHKAVEQVETLLQANRDSAQYAGDVPHSYDDKVFMLKYCVLYMLSLSRVGLSVLFLDICYAPRYYK